MSEKGEVRYQAEEPARRVSARLVASLIGLGLLILFLLQNLQEVEVNFLWFTWNVAMIWALLLAAIIGIVVGLLIPAISRRNRTRAG